MSIKGYRMAWLIRIWERGHLKLEQEESTPETRDRFEDEWARLGTDFQEGLIDGVILSENWHRMIIRNDRPSPGTRTTLDGGKKTEEVIAG